jgi:hypothetical protein
MKRFWVIAIGRETYWLKMVKKAVNETPVIGVTRCFNTLDDFLKFSKEPDLDTLLLVDISERTAVKNTVQKLRELGWQYVVVVATDPSVKEIYAVLHDAGGYDYWEKTYQSLVIRANIEKCLDEMKMTYPVRGVHE